MVVSVDGYFQTGFHGCWGDDVRSGAAPREAAVVVPESGEARLDLHVTRGLAVSGRVVGPDGRPAAHAGVALRYDVPCESDGPFRWQETTADADGAFRFTGVATTDAATLSAWCGAAGAAYDVKVALDPAHGADGVTLKLVAGGRLLVRVRAPEGIDVADARVQAIGADAGHGDDAGPDRWSADEGGAVDATGELGLDVPPVRGTWLVRAFVPGRAWSAPAAVELGPDVKQHRVDLTLVAGGWTLGIVCTPEGAAVAGARILVRRPGAQDRMIALSAWGSEPVLAKSRDVHAVTDAQGRFQLDPLDDGTYEITASTAGFTTTTAELSVPVSEPVRVEMSPARAIRGRVRFADWRPATPVRVWIHRYDDGTPTETRTAADGTFAFEGLRDCVHYLNIDPLPVGANVKPLQMVEVRPREEPFDLVVEPGFTVAGRVVDERGRPVAGCRIALFQAGTGPLHGRFAGNNAGGDSGDDGGFAFQGMDEGPYVLLASRTRIGPTGPYLAPARLDGVVGGSTGVVVTLRLGLAIAGHVVDPEGRGVAGVTVAVEPPRRAGDDPDADACWTGPIWTPERTDATGAFRIEGLPPGRCRVVPMGVSLTVPSALQFEGDADVRAGDLDLRLVASGARTIGGAVLDGDGSPIQADVELVRVDGSGSQKFQTDPWTGSFTFIGLDAGTRWRLVAAPCDHDLTAASAEAAPGEHDVRLVCAAGLRAAGRVLTSDGSPLADALVRLRRAGPENERYARTDAEGRFVAKGLLEGEYRVEAATAPPTDGRPWDWRDCGTLRAGETTADLRPSR